MNTVKYMLCVLVMTVAKSHLSGLDDKTFFIGLAVISAIYMMRKSVLYSMKKAE